MGCARISRFLVKEATSDGRRERRLKRRWKVERTYAWLHSYRRVVTRYEKSRCRYEGFVSLACAFIATRGTPPTCHAATKNWPSRQPRRPAHTVPHHAKRSAKPATNAELSAFVHHPSQHRLAHFGLSPVRTGWPRNAEHLQARLLWRIPIAKFAVVSATMQGIQSASSGLWYPNWLFPIVQLLLLFMQRNVVQLSIAC